MSSKYMQALDSLSSDENTKRKRTERILSSQSTDVEQTIVIEQGGAAGVAKVRSPLFAGKRGVAIILAIVLFFAVAVAIPMGILISNNRGMLGAMSLLKNTFVDMDGVAAFGVWNAPDDNSSSETSRISNVSYIHKSVAESEITPTEEDDGPITGEWSDEERYDWESDYDWDPTKANVLIAIDEDGNISEVVYERTNGRGQVRQDRLGNAAAVYVSNGFTYVMYVDDDDWEFWKEINFAQEMRGFSGFHCHHERRQTVVIHNATGKVFALKDLIPQVNELSGATNYTMQVQPFKDDFIHVSPMYGNYIPQWYNVIYDEQEQKIRYELVLPVEAVGSYTWRYQMCAARRDKYGQVYLLEGNGENDYTSPEPVGAGIVNLPLYARYGNALVFSRTNGMMLGTDGRMYAFDEGKLKVFGEDFVLNTVEPGTEVAFEGIAADFQLTNSGNNGIAYKLKNGYLYSMFGEVWKVDDDGTMTFVEQLQGSFPRYADDGYLMDGEIIAFVDTQYRFNGMYSANGRMVQIDFESAGGTHQAVITHILKASEINVQYNHRMVIQQNQNPYTSTRGETKYFLITVQDGKPIVEYFGYGYNGGIYGLTNPITQPLTLN